MPTLPFEENGAALVAATAGLSNTVEDVLASANPREGAASSLLNGFSSVGDQGDATLAIQMTPEQLAQLDALAAEAEGRVAGEAVEVAPRPSPSIRQKTMMGAPSANLREMARRQTSGHMAAVTDAMVDHQLGLAETEQMEMTPERRAALLAARGPAAEPGKPTLMGAPVVNLRQLESLRKGTHESTAAVSDDLLSAMASVTKGASQAEPARQVPKPQTPDQQRPAELKPDKGTSELAGEELSEPKPTLDQSAMPAALLAEESGASSDELALPELPEIAGSAEAVTAALGAQPAGAFAKIGYSFRVGKARSLAKRAEKSVAKRHAALEAFQRDLALEAGRRAWLAGEGGSSAAWDQLDAQLDATARAQEALSTAESELNALDDAFRAENGEAVSLAEAAEVQMDDLKASLDHTAAHLKEVEQSSRLLQVAAKKATAHVGRLDEKKPDGWEQMVVEARADAERATAEAEPLLAELPQLRESQAQLQKALQEAKQDHAQKKQVVDKARQAHKAAQQAAEGRANAAAKALEQAQASTHEPLLAIGAELLLAGQDGQAAHLWQQVKAQMAEDDATLADIAAATAGADAGAVKTGRITLAVVCLLPILIGVLLWLFLPFTDPLGLYGDSQQSSDDDSAETSSDSSDGPADVPSGARNDGQSSAKLAKRALPPGQSAYIGVSIQGLRNAKALPTDPLEDVLSDNPVYDALEHADVSLSDYQTLVLVFTTSQVGGAFQIDKPGKRLNSALKKKAGETEKIGGQKAAVLRRLYAWATDDGMLGFGHRRLAKKVLPRLADQPDSDFTKAEVNLVDQVDLDATVWAIVRGDVLEELQKELKGPLPGQVKRSLKKATGVAVTFQAADDAQLRVAVRFAASDDADAGLSAIKELVSMGRAGVKAAPESMETLADLAGDLLDELIVASDGDFVIITLNATAKQIKAATKAAQKFM